ncbi:MAG: Gfo/Idh/MocA family oxidoreductase [Acetobacteraceae bacterium]|nr:Gfo/Idh/MocA family oxidoreductase [Acetobacteraceae bacterium]
MITMGLVGLGWWGRMLLNSARASTAMRFVHACTRNPATGAPVAAEYGLRYSESLDAMLRDKEVRAVVISTPHSTHRALIEQVAAAGLPVFCEKPLTLTRADAVAAVDACRRAGVPFAVGHNRRFLPTIGAMQRIVREGRLGRLLHIEGHLSNENSSVNFAPWRADPEESPAGGMTGTGVHVLDAFTNLAGPARRVKATQLLLTKPSPGPLDSLSAMIEFANGMSGLLATVRVSPRFWRIHVFGERGNLETWGDAAGDTDIVLRMGDGAPPERIRFAEVDTLRAELDAFAEAATGGAPYPVPVEEMVATVAVFEAIVKSVAAGGAAVEVEGG